LQKWNGKTPERKGQTSKKQARGVPGALALYQKRTEGNSNLGKGQKKKRRKKNREGVQTLFPKSTAVVPRGGYSCTHPPERQRC